MTDGGVKPSSSGQSTFAPPPRYVGARVPETIQEAELNPVLVLTGQRPATSPDDVYVALRLALPFLTGARARGAEVYARLASELAPDDPVAVLAAWWGTVVLGVRIRDLRAADFAACDVVEPDLHPVLLATYEHADGLDWYTRWYAATLPFREGIAQLRRRAQDDPELQQLVGPLRSAAYSDVEDLLGLLGDDVSLPELSTAVALVRSVHQQGADLVAEGHLLTHPVYDGALGSSGLAGAAEALADEVLAYLPRGRPAPQDAVTAEISELLRPLTGSREGTAAETALRALGVPLAAPTVVSLTDTAPAAAPPAMAPPVVPVPVAPVPVAAVAPPAAPSTTVSTDAATARAHVEQALRILAEEASAPPTGGPAPPS